MSLLKLMKKENSKFIPKVGIRNGYKGLYGIICNISRLHKHSINNFVNKAIK